MGVLALVGSVLAGAEVIAPLAAGAATGDITSVAGTGTDAFSGDGGPASLAAVSTPQHLAVAPDGDLVVADYGNNRIRRIDAATGVITTIAGTGTASFGGDGGPATAADLSLPRGVAVDADGDVLVADYWNNRVRRIDAATGVITTVAGGGVTLGDGGQATDAFLFNPVAVEVAGDGDLLIADSANHRIRRVDAASGVITTVAGTPTGSQGGFSGDGGPATSAALAFPTDVIELADGDLVVADHNNNRVRRVDAATGVISTVAGTGAAAFDGDGQLAATADLHRPFGLAVLADGDLVVSDQQNHRVRRIDAVSGIITTVAGTGVFGFGGDGGPGALAQLNVPNGVAVDATGALMVADALNHRLRRVQLDADPATLSVVVRTDGDVVVDGAEVEVRDGADAVVATGTTWRGVLSVDGLSAGTYAITARFRGVVWDGEAVLSEGATIVQAFLAAVPGWGPLVVPTASELSIAVNEETGFVRLGVPRSITQTVDLRFTPLCADPLQQPITVTVELGAPDRLAELVQDAVGSLTWSVEVGSSELADGPMVLEVVCPDGLGGTAPPVRAQVGRVQLYDPSGDVTDAVTGEPVVGATVTLHEVPGWRARTTPADLDAETCESNLSKAPAAAWSQPAPVGEGVVIDDDSERISPNINPQTTSASGRYGWDVAAGCWYVTVEADGYEPVTSPVVGVPPEVTDLDLVLTPLAAAPGSPTAVLAAPGATGVTVTWEPPADDGGSPVTGYQVTVAAPARLVEVAPDARSAVVTGLPYGATVEVAVRASNAMGPSAAVEVVVDLRSFTDVGADHPFVGEIAWMVDNGLAAGFLDGTYRPTGPVSRQAMAAFLWRQAGEPPAPDGAPGFSDVPAGHPFAEAIGWLASSGVTTGYPDGTFRPGATISRQAMAAFLWRQAGEPPAPDGAPGFSDVPAGHPFAEAIGWLASSGVTTGYPDGTFRPSATITRQAMAAFLFRSAAGEP